MKSGIVHEWSGTLKKMTVHRMSTECQQKFHKNHGITLSPDDSGNEFNFTVWKVYECVIIYSLQHICLIFMYLYA